MFTKCPNRDCPERRWQLLKHFVGDVDGLGEKQVAQLMRAGLVRTPGDFYRLTVDQLTELEGWGEVSARRIVERLKESKSRPFGINLFAIGIEEVGYVTGRNLAAQFRSIDALLAATPEEIAQTPGVGREDGRRSSTTSSHDEQMLRADRGPARARAALRAGGRAARRGAAVGQDLRAHRNAARR